LEGHQAHNGLVALEDEGSVVALGLDVEKAGEVNAVDGVAVFEEEGVLAGVGFGGGAVFEFEDGFGKTTEVEGLDEVVDDVELVAFSSEVGAGTDDDDGGFAGEGLEKGDAVDAGQLEIEEDGVEGLGGEKVEGGGSVVDLEAVGDAADLSEEALDEVAGEGVVIDNETFHGCPLR